VAPFSSTVELYTVWLWSSRNHFTVWCKSCCAIWDTSMHV